MEICLFVEPQQGATFAQIADAARSAEAWGYDGFFRSDHLLPIGQRTGEGTTDAWTTLAGLACITSTIRLGTLVSSATFRHPALLAIQASNVDEISGGRVELGIGSGWYELEHATYGIPFPRARFDRLEEQLEVIDLLLRTPRTEAVTTSGAHYALSDAPGLADPARPPLPIIIGGAGMQRTPALAARYAREYNIFRGPDHVAPYLARVRAAAEAIGRDPQTIRMSAAIPVITGETQDAIEDRARRAGLDTATDEGDAAIGDIDAVVARVIEYRGTGVDRIYLQVADATDSGLLEQVGTRVLPRLREGLG